MKKIADAALGFQLAFFTVSGCLLSCFSLPNGWKAAVFLIGILAPFTLALSQSRSQGPEDLGHLGGKVSIPSGAWWGLAFFTVVVHFYRLETLYPWPNGDESLAGLHSLALSEQWNWKFFYDAAQIPPLSIWASALLFKLGSSTFFSLWFPSALACFLTVGTGVLAARQFFSETFSFILGCLLASSYWLFLLGRVCCEGVWLPLWVCGCLWFLGRFWNAVKARDRARELIFLGAIAGLGSFTFTSWPAVLLWLLLILGTLARRRIFHGEILYFLVPLGLTLLPFAAAVFQEGFGEHIHSNSIFSPWISYSQKLESSFSYVAALFWAVPHPGPYGPQGGGMLNPLESACFFLGLLELLRRRFQPMSWAILSAFFLFLLPGLLSMGLEMNRIAQIIPFLLLIAALGLERFLSGAPPERRWIYLSLFLILGLSFDGARILQAIPSASQVNLSEDKSAFQTLQSLTARMGPGLILCDFPADTDESLLVGSYPFNAAENPRLDRSQARWAAVLMDGHYFPFVSPRLAGSEWVWLEPSKSEGKYWVLGLAPLIPANRDLLNRWTAAHHLFRKLDEKIDDVANARSYQAAADFFPQVEALCQGDRFLESCFWERRAEFYYDYDYAHHLEDHLDALRQAIRQGYPAPHLYFKLGSLLLRKGDRPGARAAFEAALKADSQYEQAQAGLRLTQSPLGTAPPEVGTQSP